MTTGNNTGITYLGSFAVQTPFNGPVTSGYLGGSKTTVGKSWVGVDDPMFQQKIDRGISATNKYDLWNTKIIFVKRANVYVYGNRNNSTGTRYYHGKILPDSTLPTTVTWNSQIIANLTNASMAKLLKKVNNESVAYGGMELLAEFRKTIHMIKHPAESLAAYLNKRASKMVELRAKSELRKAAIRRSKGSKAYIGRRLRREENELRKTLSSSWLELQYGAKPLIGTLADMAEVSLETFPRKGAVKILKSHSKELVNSSSTYTSFHDGLVGYEVRTVDEYEYSVTLVARLRYTGQYDGMSSLELLRAKGGFSAKQLIPFAWEMTPLSVFADMFVNVGDILSAAMTETKNVISVDRYVSRRLIRRRTIIPQVKLSWGVHDMAAYSEGMLVTYYKYYSREKWALGIPPIVFTTPFDDLMKTLNLSAFLNLKFLTK